MTQRGQMGRRPRRRVWLEAGAGPQGQPVRMYWRCGTSFLCALCGALCVPFKRTHSSAGGGDSLTRQTAGLPPSRHCPAGSWETQSAGVPERPRCSPTGVGYANSFPNAAYTTQGGEPSGALGIRGPAPSLLLAPGIGRLPRAWSRGRSPPLTPHPLLRERTGQSRLPDLRCCCSPRNCGRAGAPE